MKKSLNPTLVYVLSILGLLCCCLGGLGIFLSGPAFYIAHTKVKDAQLNPEDYDGDINAMNTAKIIALVVFILNVVLLIRFIYVISTNDWEEIMEQSRVLMEEYQKNSGN
jgi:flagellar biosynthesis protein FlhB